MCKSGEDQDTDEGEFHEKGFNIPYFRSDAIFILILPGQGLPAREKRWGWVSSMSVRVEKMNERRIGLVEGLLFGDFAGAVGLEEVVEGAELGLEVFGFMGLGDGTRRVVLAEVAEAGDEVVVTVEEVVDGFEVGVLGEADGVGAHDEGVALVAVGFGEGAIDSDGVAALFDGVFSFLEFDGDVAVDDEEVLVHAEGAADLVNESRVVDFLEVRVFDFAVGFFVGDEVALEGGHLGFAEEGGVGVDPEPVVVVEVPGDGVGALAVGVADDLFELVEEGCV